MSRQLSLGVAVGVSMLLSLVSSSLVLDSYKKVLDQNGRDAVGMDCRATNQWEISRLMVGLIGKTVDDLTDEEKTKVNKEFVQQGMLMCSLRKQLYCLNNTDDKTKGTCASCNELSKQPKSPLKDMNIELCNNARRIDQLAPEKEEKKVTTIPPPAPKANSSFDCTLDGILLLLTALLIITTFILPI